MLQTKPHHYLEPHPEVARNTGSIWCIQLLRHDPGARIMPPDHTHTEHEVSGCGLARSPCSPESYMSQLLNQCLGSLIRLAKPTFWVYALDTGVTGKMFLRCVIFSRRSWTLAYNVGSPIEKEFKYWLVKKRTNAHHRIWGDRVNIARENGAMFYDWTNWGNALFPSFPSLPQPHSLPSPHLNLYVL